MALLAVKNLCAGYGRLRVLHGVSLEIGAGELVALIGPNGAGKTTLLRALSRVLPSEGQITVADEDVTRLSPQQAVAAGIAQCPEGRQLFPALSVEDNLRLGAFLRRGRAAIAADLDKVYGLFPVLAERRRQAAGTMSGGEQQMLAIGRALMCAPRLLLLDEPSFGIAPIIVDRIFAAIRALNEAGLAVLLVEQNAGLALDLAARSFVLEGGRIVLDGASATLAANERVRQAYLGL